MSLARNGRMKKGTRRMAGSRNRFSRNGLIACGLSGPPRLNRTIATLRATHQLQQVSHMLRWGLRHDAVAKVEYEGAPAHRVQDRGDLPSHGRTAGNQGHGIEVALYYDMRRQHGRHGGDVAAGIHAEA